ncbi:competence type IV pilus major pilin ComGC [Sporosarcina sp. PTS2304]|uniref:competence type IV pilus major pilin ComGC n=1 Tax=Sporosarcina sp. PTS2304 TaxID=2283194 RepID=UPI001F07D7EE|nr:competence type IV pilus major pilin ComGC [Sporosarcina sp. PTS2304]
MMIVLLIITVLILIAIPNVTKHSKSIDDKGCDAYVKMVEGQIQAFKMNEKKNPTLSELTDGDYLPESPSCPDGSTIAIGTDGKVTVAKTGG